MKYSLHYIKTNKEWVSWSGVLTREFVGALVLLMSRDLQGMVTAGCLSCSTWQVSTTASPWAEGFTRNQLIQLKVPSLFSMRVKVTSVQNMIPFSNQVSCRSLG